MSRESKGHPTQRVEPTCGGEAGAVDTSLSQLQPKSRERTPLTLRLSGSTHDWLSVIDLTVTPWREAAACLEVTDEVSFFPDAENLAAIARAKAVCASCPVAWECLTWAITTNQSEGVWGGHTPRERRAIRRRWIEEVEWAS